MATAAVTSSSTATERECPICAEPFSQPKLLQCGHILCAKCLLQWLEKNPNASCPTCRGSLAVKNGQTPQAIVDSLLQDDSLNALCMADRVLIGPHACEIHSGIVATDFCLVCSEKYCHMCSEAHQKMKMSQDHKIVALSATSAQEIAAFYLTFCSSHPNSKVAMFCKNHGTAHCLKCESSHVKCCTEEIYGDAGKAATKQLKQIDNFLNTRITDLETTIQSLGPDSSSNVKTSISAKIMVENKMFPNKTYILIFFLKIDRFGKENIAMKQNGSILKSKKIVD